MRVSSSLMQTAATKGRDRPEPQCSQRNASALMLWLNSYIFSDTLYFYNSIFNQVEQKPADSINLLFIPPNICRSLDRQDRELTSMAIIHYAANILNAVLWLHACFGRQSWSLTSLKRYSVPISFESKGFLSLYVDKIMHSTNDSRGTLKSLEVVQPS